MFFYPVFSSFFYPILFLFISNFISFFLFRIWTRSKKWYKRLLYHLIDLSLINAYILRKGDSGLPLYEFKLSVATALMYGENLPEPLAQAALGPPLFNITTAQPEDAIRLDMVNHWPEAVVKLPRCCRLKGCKLRSVFRCSKCGVFLCLKANNNCFVKYHTIP